jgi:hypothetical protein
MPMDDSGEAAKLALTTLVVLVFVITLVDKYGNSLQQTGCSRTSLTGQVFGVLTAVLVLYEYHLISLFQVNWAGSNVLRLDCLYSNKGGKRPLVSTSDEFRNPCFVTDSNAAANVRGVTEEIVTLAGIHEYGDYQPLSFCSSRVGSSKNNSIHEPFISPARDCQFGQHGTCSLDEPCTPCEISRFSEFHNSPHGWSRCQSCSLANKYGKCYFVEGVGPYCWKDSYSRDVVPCRKCCTDSIPVFDDEGVCY